jgi:hypothetical protein
MPPFRNDFAADSFRSYPNRNENSIWITAGFTWVIVAAGHTKKAALAALDFYAR